MFKTNQIIILCLTIYLSVFTHGCWKAVDSTINNYEYHPEPEQIENPVPKLNLPELFIIPTPQLQNEEVPKLEDSTPKTFASN